MKVGNIGVEHVGRNAVFAHQLCVPMTPGAGPRGFQTECLSSGILLSVRVVTFGTDRHVGIFNFQQRPSVHAADVLRINGAMTSAAVC